MIQEFAFVEEWDVHAPIAAVFEALADTRTYPAWWKPVYERVESDGPPSLGRVSRQVFKGCLPYHLRITTEIVRLEPPHEIEVRASGDLRGHGVWTLTSHADGVHIRFDWRVAADRLLLRILSPLMRPLLRWNHHWAMRRARAGLEPYLRNRQDGQG